MVQVKPLESSYRFWILKGILYALLLTPLWVWSAFLFPFITSKVIYFRLLVEIALVFYIPLALYYSEIRPRLTKLTKAIWLYLLIVIIASLFGVDFNRSFWGTVERGEGIITILHFVLYFTMVAAVFTDQRQWYRYLFFALTVTGATALYGLAQLYNFSGVIPAGTTRVSGTIGNAAFFAAVMIFGVFLSFLLLLGAKSLGRRLILWAILLFELGMLFQSQTRGAILATAAALVFYFALNIFRKTNFKVKLISAVFLCAIFGFGALVYFSKDSGWVKGNDTLARLATISPRDITTESRLDTWGASWQGFRSRWFLGFGYENYNIAFNQHFPSRIFKDQGSQIWFDRAHNIFFDVAVTSGIVGVLTYLGIFIMAFWVLFSLWRRSLHELDARIPIILGSLLVAYFLQNFFVFDTQATYLMFFVILGFIAFLEKEYVMPPLKERRSYPPGAILPLVLSVLAIIGMYFFNIEPAKANSQTMQGIKYAKLKDYNQMATAFAKALSYGTYMDQEIRHRFVDYSIDAINTGGLSADEQKRTFENLIRELEKSIAESPRDAKNYIYLMNVLNRLNNNSQAVEKVLILGAQALQLSPTRAQIYFEIGQAYLFKKDYSTGLGYFEKAAGLNPKTKETHYNYMLAAIIANEYELADRERSIIVEDLHYNLDVKDYMTIAHAYYQAGDKDRAIKSYQEGLAVEPKNILLYSGLAAVYGELCEIDKAQAAVDAAIQADSNFALQGFNYMREIEKKCQP